MAADVLAEDFQAITAGGLNGEVGEAEGWLYVLIREYLLPSGYNRQTTELLLKLPLSYPNGRPDMFWTPPDLLLADGRVPTSADSIESFLGRQWRRFSWHPQSWSPGRDSLKTYLEFVNLGLSKARGK